MVNRRSVAIVIIAAVSVVLHAGCATTARSRSAAHVSIAATPPPPASTPEVPEALERPETVEEATTVLAEIRRSWPVDRDDPLLSPENLADVRMALDRDQLTLFDGARAHLMASKDPAARPMLAELELAWGESQMLLMELLLRVGGSLAERRAVLRAGISEVDSPDEVSELGDLLAQLLRLTEALRILSIEHLAAGGAIADSLLVTNEEDPAGYRLASDYYRIIRQWPRYEPNRARLEELSPDSLDGLFLDAATAMQRDQDRKRAATLYRELLRRDSNRVRAQAHLLLIQDSLDGLIRELELLSLLNPNHQLTHWVGGFIIEAWMRSQGTTT